MNEPPPIQSSSSSSVPHFQDELLRGTTPLLKLAPIDVRDDLEKTWSDLYRKLKEWMRELSDAEINNFLNQKVSESTVKQLETTIGLLHGILTSISVEDSQMFLKYLNFSVRDGYASCIGQLKRLIHEKYTKLHDTPRERIVWLIAELVKLHVNDVDSLCTGIMRFVNTGDMPQKYLWLAQNLVTSFIGQRSWLVKNEKLLCTMVYSFLVLLLDLIMYRNTVGETGNQLASTIIPFLVEIIRENFAAVMSIGRDFARIIFDLKSFGLTEFEQLWQDMVNDPKKLEASGERYTSVSQILAVPTRARFLLNRLTPEMEKQMYFMMTQVKMGNQRRYQQWFAQKYLATNESESLIPDLIRYTCCVYHPPHNIIAANFTPRWAMLGWLLKSVKSRNGYERAKNAMIFDWLCFNPKMDSIMNIEPAMLLMLHSIPKYVDVTMAVLAALITWGKPEESGKYHYILPSDRIAENVRIGMKLLIEKGVIPSLSPIVDCPQMDTKLRDMLRQQFPQYCKTDLHGPLPSAGIPSPGPPSPRSPRELQQRASHSPLQFPTQGKPLYNVAPSPPERSTISPTTEGIHTVAVKDTIAQKGMPSSRDKKHVAEKPQIPEVTTQFSEAGNKIKERIKAEIQEAGSSSPRSATEISSLSSVVSQMSASSSVTDPQLAKLFDPHLSQFAGYTSFLTGEMDDDSDDEFFGKAVQSLRNVLSMFEKDDTFGVDRMEEDQIAQKLATFIIRCLSHELDAHKKTDQNYVLQSLVLAEKTIIFHMLDHIFTSVKPALIISQQNQAAGKLNTAGRIGALSAVSSVKRKLPRLVKRSRDRFSSMLRHACSIEPSLGYRAFCYCVCKHPAVMDEIEDVLADQLRDYHYLLRRKQDVAATTEDEEGESSQNNESGSDSTATVSQAKKHFLLYEFICQLRRRMGTSMISFFVRDMECCIMDNQMLLLSLMPILSKNFSTYTRSRQFVSMLVANIMPNALQDLLSMISVGRARIIHPISMQNLALLAEASFDWDHYEQCAFWDIVLNELTFDLFKLSADEDADEDVVAASTSCNFQDFMMQVLSNRKLDLRKNRHFLTKLQQFYTQHYQSSDDMNPDFFNFLLTRSPKTFGTFPSHFLLHWMASEPSAQQEASSCHHQKTVTRHLNKLLKDVYTAKKYRTEPTWIETAQNIIVNLWHIKNGENDIVSFMNNNSIVANLRRLKDCEFVRSADDHIKRMYCALVNKEIDWQEQEEEADEEKDDNLEEEEEGEEEHESETRRSRRRTRSQYKRAPLSVREAENSDEEEENAPEYEEEEEEEDSDDHEMELDEEDGEEEQEGEEDEEEEEEEEEEDLPRRQRQTKAQKRQSSLFDVLSRSSKRQRK